ncbi:MAG TPA: peptidylprolyl isomerase [Methylomirabilota bacterium]|nr:peptidylprolyl isomerase [Methylomirabilota bacterium]
MRIGPLAVGLVALLVGGCALPTMPRWVPYFGKKDKPPAPVAAPAARENTLDTPKPGDVRQRPAAEDRDDTLADRIIAIVNNDAITLAELQESIVSYRAENPGRRSGPSDEELRQDFLNRLIDNRLQLQEAEREKITVDDLELNEEFVERIKRYGVKTEEEFEKLVRGQGVTVESIKKRLRDGLKVSKLIRRRVTLRVSVTEAEISAYLEENRSKLETGLSFHARHILVTPESASDTGWEAARIKAEMLRSQLQDGADFVELARQHSRDATAKDGGDLGVLKRGELAPDVEAELLGLVPGQASRPVRSPLGYHVFQLESKETLEGPGIRQQIRDILFRQQFDNRLEAWLKEIKQRAIIEVRL